MRALEAMEVPLKMVNFMLHIFYHTHTLISAFLSNQYNEIKNCGSSKKTKNKKEDAMARVWTTGLYPESI